MTTIYVTHEREEALGIADRIVLMRKGRILQHGTPDQVYTQPRTAFIAQLLSDSNLLPATYLRNGWWETPVGTLKAPPPAADGSHMLLVRPEAMIRTTDGDFRGQVEAVSFRAGLWEAEVNVRGEEILWRTAEPVASREEVGLKLGEEPHPVLDDR